jgi:hypothetical protein
VLAAAAAYAPSGTRAGPYFHTGKAYGSDATFIPISAVLNEGFDFLQIYGRERRVLRYDCTNGLHTIELEGDRLASSEITQ